MCTENVSPNLLQTFHEGVHRAVAFSVEGKGGKDQNDCYCIHFVVIYLQKFELYPRLALILSNGKELHKVVMADVRRQGISMLVHHPLTACQKKKIKDNQNPIKTVAIFRTCLHGIMRRGHGINIILCNHHCEL